MSFFQPWRDVPELSSLTPAEQKRRWKYFSKLWYANPTVPMPRWLFLSIVTGMALTYCALYVLVAKPLGLRIHRLAPLAITVSIAIAPTLILRYWAINRSMRMWLHQLFQRDYAGRVFPVCIRCGYPLTGCPEDIASCPECGNEEIRGNLTSDTAERVERPDDLRKS